MRKVRGSNTAPIVFFVLAFTLLCSLSAVAQWQGANNIPDRIKTLPKPNGNTSDNSNSLTIKAVANDATTATFTVVNREGHKLNANQAKAYTVGSYAWPTGVYIGASLSATTVIDELNSFVNHVTGHPGTGYAFKILNAPIDNPDLSDTSVVVISAPNSVSWTPRGTAAGGGSFDALSVNATTFYPGTKYGGDMGCLGCHSMATDPLQHNAQQIAGEPPTTDYAACVDASAGGTIDVNPKAVCGPLDKNGYILTGHKNMLRKVLPPSATPYGAYPWAPSAGMFGPDGTTLLNAIGGTVTADWTTGLVNIGGVQQPLYYTFGWVNPPDIIAAGYTGAATNYGNYSCARCHTTGFRPDGLAPEPTTTSVVSGLNTYTDLPDDATHFRRTPAGWATGTATSSWQLTGIQCERCHNNSHLKSCDDAAVVNFTRPTIAGQTVTNCQAFADETGTWHYAKPYQPVDVQATALCIECHRQERNNSTGTYAPSHTIQPAQLPGKNLTGWPAMSATGGKGGYGALGAVGDSGACADTSYTSYSTCIAAGKTWNFKPSMSHGANGAQAFLNSPHARFGGTLAMNAQNSPDLSVLMSGGTFSSFFKGEEVRQGKSEADFSLGEANNNNGGCTACHNPHYSTVATTTPAPTPMSRECADCHTRTDQMLASTMKHPTGPGTPFPDGIQAKGNSEACVVCHMVAASGSPSYHYFRINADANYYTFGPASVWYADHDTKTATVGGASNVSYNGQPNTYVETHTDPTTFQQVAYNSVAIDVDLACGQCHGGGNSSTNGAWQNTYSLAPPSPAPPAFSRNYLAMAASGIHNTDYRTPTAAVPTFSLAAGTYATTQTVYLADATPGATIYYTTDGSTPAYPMAGTTAQYTPGAPITVAATTTINAIAGGPGFASSGVGTARFAIVPVPAAPTFTPGAGIFYGAQSVGLTTSTPNAGTTFYYTTNGTTPTTASTACAAPCSVSVGTSQTVNAIAVYTTVDGSQTSKVGSAIYRILAAPAPTFSPAPYPSMYYAITNVSMSDTASGVTICYTTNGTTPAVGATSGTCAVGTPYTASIALARFTTTTFKAVAGGPGFTSSPVVSAIYIVR